MARGVASGQIAPVNSLTPANGIGQNESAEAALASVRNKLTDGTSNLTHFRAVHRVCGDISDMAQSALQSGHGNKAPLLGGILRRLDEALENASERYLAANRRFAQASRDIEAVQAGGDAAMRGRIEDTVPAFRQLSAREYLLRVSVWVPSLSLVELVGSIWILLARQGRRRWALFPRNSPLMP